MQSPVFVVDDHADSREVAAEFLRMDGYVVEEFEAVEDALRAANQRVPAAVVTDLTFPGGLSGYDLAHELRSNPRTGTIRLIALSGREKGSGPVAPFDEIMVKPLDPSRLIRVLQRLLCEATSGG